MCVWLYWIYVRMNTTPGAAELFGSDELLYRSNNNNDAAVPSTDAFLLLLANYIATHANNVLHFLHRAEGTSMQEE